MKTSIWIIAGILVVLLVLYSRPMFQKSHTEVTLNVHTEGKDPETPRTRPHKQEIALKTDQPVFPPKSGTLVLPVYNWAPFSFKDESGKWTGADVEITEAVLNRMGYRVEWVEFPFARALEEMRGSNYVGMAPCVIGGGREEYIEFSEPVSSIFSVLWKMKDDEFSWSTYDDLDGRIVGASYYHYGAGFFEAAESGKFKVDKVAASSPELIHFRKLMQGKTDMFICELSVGMYLQNKYRPEFDNVDYCPRGVGPIRPFSFAVSKKYFEGREGQLRLFLDEFNSELRKFSKEGHRKRIFDKYHVLVKLDEDGMVVLDEKELSDGSSKKL